MGQTISTSQWYFYGRRHFTQSGYHKHIKEYYQNLGLVQSSANIGLNCDGSDGIDMNGKVVVITGLVIFIKIIFVSSSCLFYCK